MKKRISAKLTDFTNCQKIKSEKIFGVSHESYLLPFKLYCIELTFCVLCVAEVGWEILLLPPRACTNIMTGTNHLLGRAHGGKYSLELKPLHKVLIWDD